MVKMTLDGPPMSPWQAIATAGKAALRATRREAPLEDKLRDLVRLQHLYVQIVATRRALRQIERPWLLDPPPPPPEP